MHFIDMGQGEALVLIHGLASKKESWKNQFELSNYYRLIIPDLRGHGESNLFEGISIPQFARDVLSLLDSLEINKAHFCGLSMGGLVVQEIYKQQPFRVKSLTLSNTFSYSNQLLTLPLLYQKALTTNNTPISEYKYLAARKCVYNKNEHFIEEAKNALDFKEESYMKSALAALNVNYLWMLPLVKVPVFIIGSLQDEIVPVLAAKQTYLFTNKCKSKLVLFDQAGHCPNLEHKDKYNEYLLDFLQKVAS